MWTPTFSGTDYQISQTQTLYSGHYTVVKHTLNFKQFNHTWSPILEREQILRRNAVCVTLFDPQTQELLLVEQFRIGLIGSDQSPWMLELVAGIMEEGQTPLETARREVFEETGCQVHKYFPMLNSHPTPGGFSEFTHIFYAPLSLSEVDTQKTRGLLHEGEDIRLHKIHISEAANLLKIGKVTTATTQLAIQWLLLNQDSLPT